MHSEQEMVRHGKGRGLSWIGVELCYYVEEDIHEAIC